MQLEAKSLFFSQNVFSAAYCRILQNTNEYQRIPQHTVWNSSISKSTAAYQMKPSIFNVTPTYQIIPQNTKNSLACQRILLLHSYTNANPSPLESSYWKSNIRGNKSNIKFPFSISHEIIICIIKQDIHIYICSL